MNTLIEETARFLSRSNSPFIREKSLTPDEIVDLMDKGEEVANAISKDSKKDPDERKTARDVLSWIKDVRATWKKDNSLHPNVILKLMKITAIRQGKWGWSVPGGKIPSNFRN